MPVQAAGMKERDLSVVARARDGDRDAFRALVEQHSRDVFSLAHRMTGHAQDAEAFCAFHLRASRYGGQVCGPPVGLEFGGHGSADLS